MSKYGLTLLPQGQGLAPGVTTQGQGLGPTLPAQLLAPRSHIIANRYIPLFSFRPLQIHHTLDISLILTIYFTVTVINYQITVIGQYSYNTLTNHCYIRYLALYLTLSLPSFLTPSSSSFPPLLPPPPTPSSPLACVQHQY